jgi:hypothetical protein
MRPCGIKSFHRSDLSPRKQQLNPYSFCTYLNPQTLAVVGDFTNSMHCGAVVDAVVALVGPKMASTAVFRTTGSGASRPRRISSLSAASSAGPGRSTGLSKALPPESSHLSFSPACSFQTSPASSRRLFNPPSTRPFLPNPSNMLCSAYSRGWAKRTSFNHSAFTLPFGSGIRRCW